MNRWKDLGWGTHDMQNKVAQASSLRIAVALKPEARATVKLLKNHPRLRKDQL
jgi:hypothetical protein